MFKRLPFLTRAEKRWVEEHTTRLESGCLIFRAGDPYAHTIMLRGESYQITRVWFAEHLAFTSAAQNALDAHEVIHISTCPHTGDHLGATKFLCIEPTHLTLGDSVLRMGTARVRKEVCL